METPKGHKNKFISLNLIPSEVLDKKKGSTNQALIRTAGIFILLLGVGITITMTLVSLLQNQVAKGLKSELEISQARLEDLKPREYWAVVLDQRLNKIEDLNAYTSNQEKGYLALTKLIPDSVRLLLLSVDHDGTMTVSGLSGSIEGLSSFFDKVAIPDQNEKKLAGARLESLTLTEEGLLRFELKIPINKNN